MRAMPPILAHRRARSERGDRVVVTFRQNVERGTRTMALTIAAQKPIHETHAVAEPGAVDADGHILEPPTLWEDYIDPQFRDRALRFLIDENGLEELEIAGQRSAMSRR